MDSGEAPELRGVQGAATHPVLLSLYRLPFPDVLQPRLGVNRQEIVLFATCTMRFPCGLEKYQTMSKNKQNH